MAILDEQQLWSKQRERRNQTDYYQKRNLLKQRANKRHAAEKDHMVTLRAVGCTHIYVGSSGTPDTSESPADDVDCDEAEADNDATGDDCDPSTENHTEELQSNMLPMLFFYDCESTGGSTYDDHIIEVGAKVVAAPDSADIPQLEYSSLVHSSRTIVKAVQSKCGISARMLVTEPPFRHVFEEFLQWISSTVKIVDKIYELQDVKYYPVLVAHNGFAFDFLMHFADTFYDCKKQVKCNNPIFTN